jgi:hypothetical protein
VLDTTLQANVVYMDDRGTYGTSTLDDIHLICFYICFIITSYLSFNK